MLLGWLKIIELRLSEKPMPAVEIVKSIKAIKSAIKVEPQVKLRVHFEFDEFVMTEEGVNQANELGKALSSSSFNDHKFILIGHTDRIGSADYNRGLSKKRAKTVTNHLMDNFTTLRGRIGYEGHGEDERLYPGDTEQDHALNRRVEVKISGPEY